jgi:hypothetical protein
MKDEAIARQLGVTPRTLNRPWFATHAQIAALAGAPPSESP